METLSRAPMKWSAFCIWSASSSISSLLSSTRHYLSTTQLVLHPAKTSATILVTTTLGKPTLATTTLATTLNDFRDDSGYDSRDDTATTRLQDELIHSATNSSDEGLMHATRQSFNSRNDAVTIHLLESISSSTSPAQQQWTMHHRRHFQQHLSSQHDSLGDGCNYWYNDRFWRRRHTSTLNSFSRLFSSGQVWDWPMTISEYKHNVICCIYTCFIFCNQHQRSSACFIFFSLLVTWNKCCGQHFSERGGNVIKAFNDNSYFLSDHSHYEIFPANIHENQSVT